MLIPSLLLHPRDLPAISNPLSFVLLHSNLTLFVGSTFSILALGVLHQVQGSILGKEIG